MSATTDRATCTHPDIRPDVEVYTATPENEYEAEKWARNEVYAVMRIETCASCGAAWYSREEYVRAYLAYLFPNETPEAAALLAARAEPRMMPHTPHPIAR